MDPVVIGGIIAAAGAVGSSVINAASSGTHPGRRKLNRQKELAAYNQQLQNEAYEKYQSPKALMQQYQEAGLNPNLIYGSAQPSGPGVAQVDSSAADYDDGAARAQMFQNAFTGAVNGLSTYFDLKSKQIQNQNGNKVGRLYDAQAQAQEDANDFNRIVKAYKIEDLAQEVANKQIKNGILRQTGLLRAQQDIAESKERILSSKMSRREKRRQIQHLDVLDEQIKSATELNRAHVKEVEQAVSFAKDYHPYRLIQLKIGNALASQAYSQNGEMFQYRKQGAAYDNALKHQKLTTGYTMLPYQMDAMVEGTRGKSLSNQQKSEALADHDVNQILHITSEVTKNAKNLSPTSVNHYHQHQSTNYNSYNR